MGYRVANIQGNHTLGHMQQLGRVFVPVPVEQGNLVAGAKSADHGKVVSFITFQVHRSRMKWPTGVKSFGHPWYNTPRAQEGHPPAAVRSESLALGERAFSPISAGKLLPRLGGFFMSSSRSGQDASPL